MPKALHRIPRSVILAAERMLNAGSTSAAICRKLKIHANWMQTIKSAWARKTGRDLTAGMPKTRTKQSVEDEVKQLEKMANSSHTANPKEVQAVGDASESVNEYLQDAKDQRVLRKYRKHLRKQFPVEDRAKALASLAKKYDEVPFIAIRAIEMIDKADGMAELGKKDGAEGITPGPMFVLPPGDAVVAIRVVGGQTPTPTPPASPPPQTSAAASALRSSDDDKPGPA